MDTRSILRNRNDKERISPESIKILEHGRYFHGTPHLFYSPPQRLVSELTGLSAAGEGKNACR